MTWLIDVDRILLLLKNWMGWTNFCLGLLSLKIHLLAFIIYSLACQQEDCMVNIGRMKIVLAIKFLSRDWRRQEFLLSSVQAAQPVHSWRVKRIQARNKNWRITLIKLSSFWIILKGLKGIRILFLIPCTFLLILKNLWSFLEAPILFFSVDTFGYSTSLWRIWLRRFQLASSCGQKSREGDLAAKSVLLLMSMCWQDRWVELRK